MASCRIFQVTWSCESVAFESMRSWSPRQRRSRRKVPDLYKVFIVRSLVPKDLEKDLLKIHPTVRYKTTEEFYLEQASLEREAHVDDRGKHDKLVPMEVDALLAKVISLKECSGEKDEASDGH